MTYSDGQTIALGDRMKLWSDRYGRVVDHLDTNDYAPRFPAAEWRFLEDGMIVEADDGAVFHCPVADEDLEFVGDRADV